MTATSSTPKPGDPTLLTTASNLKIKQNIQKAYSNYLIQLLIGIVFYAPNIQNFRNKDTAWSEITKLQYFFLSVGMLMSVHAVTNLSILLYKSLFEGEEKFQANLTFLQAKLLGLARGPKENVKKPDGEQNSQLDESILIADKLPSVNQPLINDNFKTPTKKVSASSKLQGKNKTENLNTNFSNETNKLISSPEFKKTPINLNTTTDSLFVNKNSSISRIIGEENANNSSFIADDSTKMLDGKKSANERSLFEQHSYGSRNSFINSFVNDQNNQNSRLSNSNLDDTFHRTPTSIRNVSGFSVPGTSPNQRKTPTSRFANENAFRNSWNNDKNYLDGNSLTQEQMKNNLSNQLYRLSTPPASPGKALKSASKLSDDGKKDGQKIDIEANKKMNLINDYNFPFNKYDKVDNLKGWLNQKILCPMNQEIKNLDKIFVENGLKKLDEISYELIYAVCCGNLNFPVAQNTGAESSEVNSKLAELQKYSRILEPYRARLTRLLPFISFDVAPSIIAASTATTANSRNILSSLFSSVNNAVPVISSTFTSLLAGTSSSATKTKTTLSTNDFKNVLTQIDNLSKYGYLSIYNEKMDSKLINNCIIQYLNTAKDTTELTFYKNNQNWFSENHLIGDDQNDYVSKEDWVKNLLDLNRLNKSAELIVNNLANHNEKEKNNKKEQEKISKFIKTQLADIYSLKFQGQSSGLIASGQWNLVIEKLCPLFILTKDGPLVLKSSSEVFNFTSNLATFESWILFFEICKELKVDNVVDVMPV